MAEVTFVVRTADKTRKNEVTVSRENTGADIIQAAVDKWSLPTDTDYRLVNATSGKSILPTATLVEDVVKDNEVLEVQPVLVAGINDECAR